MWARIPQCRGGSRGRVATDPPCLVLCPGRNSRVPVGAASWWSLLRFLSRPLSHLCFFLPAPLLYFEECSTHCNWAHGGLLGTRHPPPIKCTCSMEHAHWGPWPGAGRAERAWEAEGLEMLPPSAGAASFL